MGFFNKKPQVIKFDQNMCNAKVDDNEVLFVRVNSIVEKKDALVEVPFTHVALLIKGGGDMRLLESGNYKVFDSRGEVGAWKRGLSVEVIYMPKETDILIYWGTPERFIYRDPYSLKTINIGARGQFGINITNPEQFFRKLVGAKAEFSREDFESRVLSDVVNEFCDVFCQIAHAKKLTYEEFTSDKKRIASLVCPILNKTFDERWGIELSNFVIDSINLAEGENEKLENYFEENRREIKDAINDKMNRDEAERIDDKNWEREKYLRELELRDKAAYYAAIKDASASAKPKAGSFCSGCGAEIPTGAAFCTACGKPKDGTKVFCKECGAENASGAKFCQKCGKPI